MLNTTRHSPRFFALLYLLIIASPNEAFSRDGTSRAWTETFQSSPASYENAPILNSPNVPAGFAKKMRTAEIIDGTVRYRLTVAVGGSALRIRLSNEEGHSALALRSISVGLAGTGYDIRPGTIKPVTFGGNKNVSLSPGVPALSDPVALDVGVGRDVIISMATERPIGVSPMGLTYGVAGPGDQTSVPALSNARAIMWRPWVSAVSVVTIKPFPVVVAFGDSITDGNRRDANEYRSWPELLSARFRAFENANAYSVVNAGIRGNRLLFGGWGEAGLARLDRDVFRIPNVSHLILLEGTNDIGMSGKSGFGDNPVVNEHDLINGYRQVIARAHEHHVKVIIGTITPFGESISHYSPGNEAVRQAVNKWIRDSGEPDAVVDFDKVLRDPKSARNLFSKFSRDGLHPNDAGYRAMANAIDLSIFPEQLRPRERRN